MKGFCIILSLTVLISCKSGKNIEDNPLGLFPDEIALQSIRLNTSNDIFRALQLLQINEFLVVSDPNDFFHFSVIDIENDQFKFKFGKIGDGPCEINFRATVQRIKNSGNLLGVFNKEKFNYLEFHLDSIQTSSTYGCELHTASFDVNYQKLIKVGNDDFVGVGIFEKKYAQSRIGENTPFNLDFDYHSIDLSKSFEYGTIAMASQGDMELKPDGSRFVATTWYAGNFDIIQHNGDGLELVVRKEFWPVKFEEMDGDNVVGAITDPDTPRGFVSTTVSDNYIYMLFSGKIASENPGYNDIILVFDWDGHPIKRYRLDHEVNKISVSDDDKILVGYADDGKANLYKFEIG